MDEVRNIRDFIVENFLFGEEGNLKNDTDLINESIVDSTGVLQVIAFLEMNYGIQVSDDEIVQDNFSSINSINEYLKLKHLNTSSKVCAE